MLAEGQAVVVGAAPCVEDVPAQGQVTFVVGLAVDDRAHEAFVCAGTWLTACRRLARDYERHPEVSEGIIR